MQTLRHLILILGDQLDAQSAAFDGFDAVQDAIVMIEALEESTHVWSHKQRSTLFLSAMRHFAAELQTRGWRVIYRSLGQHADVRLADGLQAVVKAYSPQRVIGIEPGDDRVRKQLDGATFLVADPASSTGENDNFHIEKTAFSASDKRINIEWREDRHFLCSITQFRAWAARSKTLRMEFFYREMRKRYKVLMDATQPLGGQWNFDSDNRASFGKAGPQNVPARMRFSPDTTTQNVMRLVEEKFPDHPGKLSEFAWPVTRSQALEALDDFIQNRLAQFGQHQDAMWTKLEFGWHSLLSSSLNLKLLHPLEVIQAAEQAYHARGLDLASVEGFIRQILGWREFIRGVYFLDMPQLAQANHFDHQHALPAWYWTGQTRMNCMRQCITQTLDNGYSHHIQRLMVTGMFGVMAQIRPQEVCDWYLAVYIDAVDWVELPNTAGMALYANGGRFTSKPYIASGAYIKRMSNYCQGCHYAPEQRMGIRACPMTTLYWNFLDTHEAEFSSNPRTALMVKNLQRMSDAERQQLRQEAQRMLSDLNVL